jgi:hypothetical protein
MHDKIRKAANRNISSRPVTLSAVVNGFLLSSAFASARDSIYVEVGFVFCGLAASMG